MFNRIYRLVDVQKIECFQRELTIDDKSVIVKPIYLSICKADQRYFNGNRDRKIMHKKLPMALMHEGVCEVLYDESNEYKVGDKVVVVPNFAYNDNSNIKGNYKSNNKFMSSNTDGLMQDLVKVDKRCLVKINDNCKGYALSIYAMTELLSVAYNAYDIFSQAVKNNEFNNIGIWGDGIVSYLLALVLKYELPNINISIVGKNSRKLNMFSFANNIYDNTHIPKGMEFDHCFECVGGESSEDAINQIISIIKPQGIISLLGVSERNIPINTRDVLTKGLTIIGHSRSEKEDFEKAVGIIKNSEYTREYINKIITKQIEVKTVDMMVDAFKQDLINDFKTVIKWSV